jgi:hypothetical protein
MVTCLLPPVAFTPVGTAGTGGGGGGAAVVAAETWAVAALSPALLTAVTM